MVVQDKIVTGPASPTNPVLEKVGIIKSDKRGPETVLDRLKNVHAFVLFIEGKTARRIRVWKHYEGVDMGIRGKTCKKGKQSLSDCDSQLATWQTLAQREVG